MRKPTDEKRRELELRDELERLVNSDIQDMANLVNEAKGILPSRVTNFMDYDGVKIDSDTKADDIVDSIAEFYLDRGIIQEIPYIQQKNVVDKITVSNLLFQMKDQISEKQ
jgi:Mg/Co/Ni transporter MgtE